MKRLMRNLRMTLIVFLCVSLALTLGIVWQQHRSKTTLYAAAGENKAALKTRYAQAGSITSADGQLLAYSVDGQRLYCEDDTTAQAVLHVVGDYTHNIANTIEARYQGTLLGTDRNILHQFMLDILGKGLSGDDITLTINGALSKKAYQVLNGRAGAVVLLNYTTGAILASVSSPSTSPDTVIRYEGFPDTALFDRAFLGAYAPGSTFKLVTTLACLQQDGFDAGQILDCTGRSAVSEQGADETGDGHGPVDLAAAFRKSCNVYFGQAGVQVGRSNLLTTARQMGYGLDLSADRLAVTASLISCPDDDTVLSWLSIGQPVGQSVLSLSPLQMAMMAGAIGYDGVMQQAHVIDHFTNPLKVDYATLKPAKAATLMDPQTAASLEALMIDAVGQGTGTAAAISGYTVAGKTGTVQVEGKENNALFVGYIVESDMPLAIALVVEEGGSGGNTAAPIAAELLQAAVGLLAG